MEEAATKSDGPNKTMGARSTYRGRVLSLWFVFLSLARGILLQESVHSVDFGALPHMLESIIKRFAEKVEMRLCLRDCVVNLVVIRQENLLLLAKVVHIDQGAPFNCSDSILTAV